MNQSVVKALKLLDLFTEGKSELTLKEIADKSQLPKPTVYRLLSSLEFAGYLRKIKETEHDSRYRLGLKLLELGQLVSDQLELRNVALPFMEQLAHDLNEVIHLVIVNQEEATYIEKVESSRALRLYTRIGKSSPLYLGSGPKMLLAMLPKGKQEEILRNADLFRLRDEEQIGEEALRKELEMIRKKGYAYSIGEQDADTTGISFPIYDHQHQVVAALAVSGLSKHFEGENLTYIKEKTQQTATNISSELGYRSKTVDWEEIT
ncbi:IclR family transcriptional regulator [Oceanobacillus halotolerans]|uniref:IclR family transcriptional regulator n=1 Tax=Oceanobacillus halotolerans TaxID=2663380 RepID=UPI0013DBD410|nr:IclR family transcriptional regulator [Oceanobacillus halotolerans]